MTIVTDAPARTLNPRAEKTQRLSVVRLGTLYRLIMRSAGNAYGRELGYCNNDWLLISFIGEQDGPVQVTEVAARLLLDKAQVSRVAARLVGAGVLLRDHDRGPFRLSKKGEEIFVRILQIRHDRNVALLDSVPLKDLQVLDKIFDKLFAGAHKLLEEERRRASRPAPSASQRTPRPAVADTLSRADGPETFAPLLIVPDLHALLRVLRQSAKADYGRATGLANSDWLTLTHIARNAPVTLSELTTLLDRDKSQVGRSLGRLVSSGYALLGERRGPFSAMVALTPEGEALYDAVVAEAERRNEIFLAELTAKERRVLDSVTERLMKNALVLLEREPLSQADRDEPTVARKRTASARA